LREQYPAAEIQINISKEIENIFVEGAGLDIHKMTEQVGGICEATIKAYLNQDLKK